MKHELNEIQMVKAVGQNGEESIKECNEINSTSLYRCSIKLQGLKNFNIVGSFEIKNQTMPIEQSASVTAVEKKYSVMIQTDKSHYKPGEEVKMRIFSIQPSGLPVSIEEITSFHVEIRNKYGEVVKTFTIKDYRRVVYSRTFQIDQDAFLGTHKIHVWSHNNNTYDYEILFGESIMLSVRQPPTITDNSTQSIDSKVSGI